MAPAFRLIGIGASPLLPGEAADQPDLADPDSPRRNATQQAIDALRGRFGARRDRARARVLTCDQPEVTTLAIRPQMQRLDFASKLLKLIKTVLPAPLTDADSPA